MLTTLIASKARPFGSSKGAVMSMVVHGVILAGVAIGTAKAVLPPREKFEEHPVLYVAPPPPPVHVAPDPLPKVKAAPAPAPKREAPRPRLVQPKPAPKAEAKPVIAEVPKIVAVALGNVDLKAPPALEVATPQIAEPAATPGSGAGKPARSDDTDAAGGSGSKGSIGSGSSGKAYSENQVDRTVEVTRNVAPRYPESLRSVGVQGVVVLRFIVSADGKVEPGSIEVMSTPHKLFADAVRTALLNTRYRPAEAAGAKVRQLVEQNFTFKLNAADP